MILMGDEVRRTQGGNNNAYCHDNESNWFDWSLVEKHADVHRFVTPARRAAAAARCGARAAAGQPDRADRGREQGLARREAGPAGLGRALAQHRVRAPRCGSEPMLVPPDPERLLGAARVRTAADRTAPWRRWIDTSLPSPEDIVEWQKAPASPGSTYRAGPRSVVVLYAVSG